MGGVSFGLLGPINVWSGGEELDAGSPQQRGVLALLLLGEGRQVSLDEIVSALWDGEAPRSAVVSTRTYVSRLRRMLADGGGAGLGTEAEIRSAGGGYQLVVDPGTVDVTVFRQTAAAAREARERGNAAEASRLLRGALALWRGPAFDGLGGAFFEGRRTWLEQLRASAMEERWALDIERGDCGAAIAELTLATAAEPYRERWWELLMWALDRDGRRTEALAAYRRVARLLDDDLGLDPGPGLRRMHARIGTAAGASLV
ncbi:AfsR/SARP family transcriptional regulator [Nonomuraea gerenzanensis]|uniref:Putative regulatory protein (AfsR-like protein) n=1 Tax=Nonomuraea gerenzanensis TaxID=93944 RepID=A0A1M4EMN7_9ACTN|nr:BTAD domain-containing putative transcriptional regulator [Nonomuraea gerenzanensis]UBU11355.1 winged helix-turn-helix domain-containing protein [Nonomuraea gerenzanensis]SBO99833.1 putative regulatory protein (AfsR-like protein) [Nonomuraea gerenzanensis]